MDEILDLVVKKLECLEAFLQEYRDGSVRWQQAQDHRNRLRNASIAEIRDTLDGVEISLAARQRKTLSVPEAARYARVRPGTIRRWLANGRLHGTKIGDAKQSRWRIRKQDLDQALSRNTNHPE